MLGFLMRAYGWKVMGVDSAPITPMSVESYTGKAAGPFKLLEVAIWEACCPIFGNPWRTMAEAGRTRRGPEVDG